ncbi:polynucleotide kinase-phosphatase [Pontibacter sp. G13]|uniref:polynucleotide kinase-phosphatase n=1 Tax=Pontibacter sp. G13 TaxID=3074898 RepID=UPI00288B4C81|nr:polynucleotide kinase-phosphatase [Pontibacter sp. G13]WNJ18734.1 polynucleotide kinase-phosphatase [Pontibacter sp. G13]
MKLTIPEFSLVLLIGPSGAGKSTFARQWFKLTEVVSSDRCRAMISDDENDKLVSDEAFELLHQIVSKRLKIGKLTVVDATNVQAESRKSLIQLAKSFHCQVVAIMLDVPLPVCLERNRQRTDRRISKGAIRWQRNQMRQSFRGLKKEGFRKVIRLTGVAEIESLKQIVREALVVRRPELRGPFDVIGDVHGCYAELTELLAKLGYEFTSRNDRPHAMHPEGRTAVFVGDLVDRGPQNVEVLKLVMNMVDARTALCVPGNHDDKLKRKLQGKDVQLQHGLEVTWAEFEQQEADFHREVHDFIYRLPLHYVLDDGKLVVSHAGIHENMHGRESGAVRSFCLYGETTGEKDEHGLPVRYNWAQDYSGNAYVVFGHTPMTRPAWLNRTLNIDTGCVFGGKLTALQYPEMETVQVEAHAQYCAPSKPFEEPAGADGRNPQQMHDDHLYHSAVAGKLMVQTKLRKNLTIREGQTHAALEMMGRFGINPKWLIYLPPTMSPPESSELPDILEHPTEAFKYYLDQGIEEVMCEEKHMGSRAVAVICQRDEVAMTRFGLPSPAAGVVYSRSGRKFFETEELERELLLRMRASIDQAGLWDEHQTDWICLDMELLPWSTKAQSLLQHQYAPVGTAAITGTTEALKIWNQAKARGLEVNASHDHAAKLLEEAVAYREVYRGYCWDTEGLQGIQVAPFHLLASEGAVHADKSHDWHLGQIRKMGVADPELWRETRSFRVQLTDEDSVRQAIETWESWTSQGGEGMVVKPPQFLTNGDFGAVQPAIKCRGREYLRIIYGMSYDRPDALAKLKPRKVKTKRSLALREFALGLEALERFVAREPLRRIHECSLAVLALEAEEVDPRL